jgi:hypothetical protein
MLNNKITNGKIWIGKTWEYAINSMLTDADCRIRITEKYKNPNQLLDDTKVFNAYYLEADAGTRSFRTKIPAQLNEYVDSLTPHKRIRA